MSVISSPKANLLMGVVGRPHGIKGELALDWHGEYLPRRHDRLLLRRRNGSEESFLIETMRAHKGRLLITLSGVADRTAAQQLTGAAVYLPKSSLPKLAEDEAFLDDLPGCQVYLADGSYLGVMDHLESMSGQVVWAILDQQKREILFPANPVFIKGIDVGKHRIIIDPPEGLLEIYRA